MSAGLGRVYFTDENTLGLGKLLRRQGRDDVLHPGHEDLLEVPLGALDLDWMPVVARRGRIVLTRDRHIRTRPAELRVYLEHGIRSVWIGAKQDLGPTIRWRSSSSTRHGCNARSPSVGLAPGLWR